MIVMVKWYAQQAPTGDIIAWCDNPKLKGITWWWTPNTGQVEFGLQAGSPVSSVNVWDYTQGKSGIAATCEALTGFLAEYYNDEETVDAAVSCIVHGN